MKTKPVYLVIDTLSRKGPTVRRATQLWPSLEGGEIVVRVAFTISDDLLPQVQEIELSDVDAMAVVAEAVELEPPIEVA